MEKADILFFEANGIRKTHINRIIITVLRCYLSYLFFRYVRESPVGDKLVTFPTVFQNMSSAEYYKFS